MSLFLTVCCLATLFVSGQQHGDYARDRYQSPLANADHGKYQHACPEYGQYSKYTIHPPYSEGPLGLPFQRPSHHCRTFSSPAVEQVIEDLTSRMQDKDLARIFENAFPNTLDTTVRWHTDGRASASKKKSSRWDGPQSFIVTGDIQAMWIRDSTHQLAAYQAFAKYDETLFKLILGTINTQAEFVVTAPYCNAFQPPPPSKLAPSDNGQGDSVHPAYEPSFVFECKYELDSLASFLSLTNQFYHSTGSTAFLHKRWINALQTLMAVVDQQSTGSFDSETYQYLGNEYTFRRETTIGTETLALGGLGNPLASGAGLVRSAFRPSDDATILGYFIPANAMLCVELRRTARMLEESGKRDLGVRLKRRADVIEKGIYEHGVVEHKKYGRVFAYEVDGYGSHILMDDANVPSLLALPFLGFVERDNEIYQNTRKMILSERGNPYFLRGHSFSGIGGPHIGLEYAWPMSLLIQAMTSDDDEEIMDLLEAVKSVSSRGLINESINVNLAHDFTRSWFAWANSVFAQTILDLARRKPELLLSKGSKAYRVEELLSNY